MPHRTPTIASAVLALTASAGVVSAQQSTLPPILPEAREVALAMSAGPASISRDAAVYVLRRGGYVKVKEGTNGHVCLVSRDHPLSIAPECYNPEGAATILPGVFRIAELVEKGATYSAAKAKVDSLYASGALRAPSGPAISYMLSRDQVLYSNGDAPDSQPVGPWRPHVMLFIPGATAEHTGAGEHNEAHPFVADAGKPTAHLIFVVPEWSTPSPTSPK